jgi:CHASE2 domain-containing sensor protein
MKDFFVSYTSADRAWAEWIAWRLEEAGYSTLIQAWDFRPGENFVVEMQQAAAQAKRTILVLSEEYLKSSFTQPEWAAAFAQDPTGQLRQVVPVRIQPCEPQGLLRAIIFIDLVGLGEDEARQRLLDGLADRGKPVAPPPFPGQPPAPFPGPAAAGPREPPAPTAEAAPAAGVGPESPVLSAPGPTPAPEHAAARARSRRRVARAAIAYLAASLVVLVSCWVGLLSLTGADDWLERRFLTRMQRYLPPPDVRDVLIVRAAKGAPPFDEPGPSWRGAHAEMIDAFAAAGARVIVFDMDFAEWSEHDGALAKAIARAAARNVPVVIGARDFDLYAEGKPWPRIAQELADLPGLRWGTLSGGTKPPRIELAQRLPPEGAPDRSWLEAETLPVVPSLALQAVMGHEAKPGRPAAAVLRPRADAVEVRSEAGRPPLKTVPVVDARLDFIVDVGDRIPSASYLATHAVRGNPGALSRFKDKVVVIGFEVPEEEWTAEDGQKRYGMEIQASAIAQILNGAYLRRLRPTEEFGAILFLGGLGWLLRTSLTAWTRRTLQLSLPVLGKPVEVPTVFLAMLVAYLVTGFLACKQLRVVPRFLYDVAAFLLSYYAVGWATAEAGGSAAEPAPPKAA